MSQDTARAWGWSVDKGWQPAEKLVIPALSPALLYGETLFESLRAHRGRWLAVRDHLSRLEGSFEKWGWALEPSFEQIRSLLDEGLSKIETSEGYARLTCWPSGTGRGPGILPETASGWFLLVSQLNGDDSMEGPLASIGTARSIGRDGWALPYDSKHGNYLPSRWAAREAKSRGLDDVVLCRRDGSPVEASSSNLLIFDGEAWLTPELGKDGLNGIARAALLDGGHIQEAPCTSDLLERASSIALINSVRGLRVVERVDDRPLQESEEAVAHIRRAWMEVVERWLRDA